MWAYEACRLFRDKLVGDDAQREFDAIISSVVQSDWSMVLWPAESEVCMYVTWGSMKTRNSISLKFGSHLGMLTSSDMYDLVHKTLVSYGQ